MTVTLNLKLEVEAKISQRAAQEGSAISVYVERMIEERVQPEKGSTEAQREKNQAALAMLEQQDAEYKTDDPRDIAQRRTDLEEFMAGMNASHTSDRIIHP